MGEGETLTPMLAASLTWQRKATQHGTAPIPVQGPPNSLHIGCRSAGAGDAVAGATMSATANTIAENVKRMVISLSTGERWTSELH